MCKRYNGTHSREFKLESADAVQSAASQLGNTVINLSNVPIGTADLALLEKGLNFIPTPKQFSKLPILNAHAKLARRLKLAYHFRNSRNFTGPKFIPKSQWSPPEKNIPEVVFQTIKNIQDDFLKLAVPKHEDNLTSAEIKALDVIRNDPRLIIKPADKG